MLTVSMLAPAFAGSLFVAGEHSASVVRFDVATAGAPAVRSELAVSSPTGITVAPWGELFVSNVADGTVWRFLDPTGPAPVPNGWIDVPAPQELAFRGQELFVASMQGHVARFVFGPDGEAVPSGQITEGLGWEIRSLEYEPVRDELFVSMCCGSDRVLRYRFDPSGAAILAGTISDPLFANTHGLAFSPSGDLFVANAEGPLVRFTFDPVDLAIATGTVADPLPGAIGLAMAPWGELFVAHTGGRVTRFLVDETGAAPSGELDSGEPYLSWATWVDSGPRDEDEDGVTDDADACPGTAAYAIASGDGCAVAQTCRRDATWPNPGAYVTCVVDAATRLYDEGLVTRAQRGAMVSRAASGREP